MNPVTVLVVDDSSFVRRAFARVLSPEPLLRLLGEAEDGERAVELCCELKPDVVLLDLGMPRKDGLSTLKELRKLCPATSVVVVSASTRPGADATLSALEMGAFDFVDKSAVSTMEVHTLGKELVGKIFAAAAAIREQVKKKAVPPVSPELLCLGASTGGPPALARLLEQLEPEFPAPIAVVQHIPAGFLEALVERIGERTRFHAKVAQAGERMLQGTVYFARIGTEGGVVKEEGVLYWQERAPQKDQSFVPSVDGLFQSAAKVCGARAWGALLTGMGQDGAIGLLSIRRAGGLTLAQDAATSAVYGMPKVAKDMGAVSHVLPLHEIASTLNAFAQSSFSDSTVSPNFRR